MYYAYTDKNINQYLCGTHIPAHNIPLLVVGSNPFVGNLFIPSWFCILDISDFYGYLTILLGSLFNQKQTFLWDGTLLLLILLVFFLLNGKKIIVES